MIRYLATAVIAAVLSGATAWSHRAALADVELAALRQARDTEAAALMTSNARHLKSVWERGDDLAASLASTQTTINKLHQERTNAITRLATGRRCLDADLVGVLNSPQPAAADRPDPLPTPASDHAAAHAAPFATDADVGQWSAAARRDYSTCAARLSALIDWHGSIPAEK